MGKNISKDISRYLSGNYSPKSLDHAKLSSTYSYKTSKRVIQKTTEATDDFIGNKIANEITGIPTNSQQNNSKQLQMSMIKKYLKKYLTKGTYISRRKTENYWWSDIDIIV